jgi:V8-like Glu-specific endopeptidase
MKHRRELKGSRSRVLVARFVLLGAAAAVLLIVADIASAAVSPGTLEEHAAPASAASISAYWTPARMRDARPADIRLPGSPGGTLAARAAGIPFSRFRISNTTAPGVRMMGKVFFTRGGTDWLCSATVVVARNKSLIFTAGHCVFDDGAWDTKLTFVPAYSNGRAPFGKFVARNMWSPNGWLHSGLHTYDMAAVTLGRNNQGTGRLVQTAVGDVGIAWNQTRSQLFHSFGYPAARPFTGQSLWECVSRYGGYDDSEGTPWTMGMGCDMTGGASGGGWIIKGGYLNGLVSYGYKSLPGVLFSPYFGNAAKNLWNTAQR